MSGAAAQDLNHSGSPFTNSGTYIGNVLSNTDTITNDVGATWDGAVISNAGHIGNYGSWLDGEIKDNQFKILNHVGATWRGDILAIGSDGAQFNWGDWFGDIRDNEGTVYNDGVWTGDILGNQKDIVNGLDPNYSSLWDGDVLGNSSYILNYLNGRWEGDVVDNAGDIANYADWTGNLTNRGRIINFGVWTGDIVQTSTFFWAENRIDGNFDNRGRLQLTGDLDISGMLTSSGRLELTHNAASQTLSVGSVVLSPTSSYYVNVNSAGDTDKIVATGNAALAGEVHVVAATGGAPYASPTTYTIVTAGSISGEFSGVTTDLAFFAPHISYDDGAAYLSLKRNDVGFGQTGATGNQVGVGKSVELLGAGNPLYDAVLWLSPEQAQDAFGQLSGEAHASAETMSLEFANVVGGVALGRMRQSFGALDASDSASGYAAGPVLDARPSPETAFWTQFYGAVRLGAASLDTASLSAATGGIALGTDGLLGDWRLGMMLHAGSTSIGVPSLGSTIGSTDYGLGIYGGREWGDTRLALGAVYTRHDIHSARNVSFSGVTDVLSGHYAANTAQAFAELSHEFDLGAVSLLPYAGLAHVIHATDAFTETGGAAALSRAGNFVDATFTMLGLRAEEQIVVGDDMLLTASASLGWRRAFGDLPGASYALAGSTNFSVVGAPIVTDVLVLGAALNLELSETAKVDINYESHLNGSAQTHSLRGTWATKF